jgi:hypothetical protein
MGKQSNDERNRKRRQNYAIARKKLATTKMVCKQERRRLQKSASRQGIKETKAAERYVSNIL